MKTQKTCHYIIAQEEQQTRIIYQTQTTKLFWQTINLQPPEYKVAALTHNQVTALNLDRYKMEDLNIYGKIILKWILQETGWEVMCSIQVELVEGCCECSNEPWLHKIHGISWHDVEPLASYEDPCSIWLVLTHMGNLHTENEHTHNFHCSSPPFVLILYPSHKWQILKSG